MFYCRDCGDQRGWPTDGYLPKSIGLCEMCREKANCYDVPSSALPLPPRTTPVQDAIESIKKTIEKRSA